MTPYELIRAKRDGGSVPPEALRGFVAAYGRGEVPDYQMAALCMAVFFRGLDPLELRTWTEAMLRSGDVLDLSDVPGAKIDKHSTGGVGDKVSLALAPARRRVRREGPDDVGARSWPHRRHARQARSDSGFSRRALARRNEDGAGARRLRDDRPDIADCSR
jgi:hypothetical protein